jgi:hypothetical protein
VLLPHADLRGLADEVLLRATVLPILVLVDIEQNDMFVVHLPAAADVHHRTLGVHDHRDAVQFALAWVKGAHGLRPSGRSVVPAPS